MIFKLIPLWKPRVLHYFLHALRNGAILVPPVVEASSFVDDEVLDVPGRPRVIHTPGHTAGNAAVSLEDRDVLVVGDALVTIDLVSGESGPRLLPRFFNDDHELAFASLRKIEPINARWVLPGHGLPWQGSPQQAVKLAREVAARTASG
jgi:glyoxylase-like metal-dependent hydrolase (beta-lactamase superfamily II)